LDIPGVSEMFCYYMLKNLKMAAKNEGVTEVFKKLVEVPFLGQSYPCHSPF